MSTLYELWKVTYHRHLDNMYEILTENNKTYPEFPEFCLWLYQQRKYTFKELAEENELSTDC